jgi:pyruvate dehydrogenase E2 component (dihydrolipoamide acetyltransferase)
MAIFFSMPKLGMNMTEGTIVSWLLREGDPVEAGQPIVDVETDKAVNTVDAPASGVLARIVKDEGETVPCTFVIAVITQAGEEVPQLIPEAIADGVRPTAEVEVVVAKDSETPEGEGPQPEEKRLNVSPSAKALAKELGIDIRKVAYTGDRITRKDVETAFAKMQAESQQPANPESQTSSPTQTSGLQAQPLFQANRKAMTLMRKRIAEHMSASARNVARVGLKVEVNASRLIAWRAELRKNGLQTGYSELLAKLVALALSEYPYMNSRLVGEEIWEIVDRNIGIAVDVDGGLLVPVVLRTDQKSIAEIHRDLAEKVERARLGRSIPSDLDGGTFTLTNLGAFDIQEFLPVINYPECAILGVGTIVRCPVAVDEHIEIQPRMMLTLAFDHRLVDGAPAARFLQRLKQLVENPPEG